MRKWYVEPLSELDLIRAGWGGFKWVVRAVEIGSMECSRSLLVNGTFDVGVKMESKVDRERGRHVRTQSTNGECSSGPVVGRCSYRLGALLND